MEKEKLNSSEKIIERQTLLFLIFFFGIFGFIANKMGTINMIKTILNTSYDLLMNVCLYLMAITVITGGIGQLFLEFGVIDFLNKILSIFMKPLYSLPGASAWGIITCYISDNPAMISLARNEEYKSFFKKFQFPALTNLGTSFGMGLIVTTTMMSMPVKGSVPAALIGNLGAIIGSIVSVRLMLAFTKKYYKDEAYDSASSIDIDHLTRSREKDRPKVKKTVFERFINSLIDGGKSGVEIGLSIIPGVLIICTFVLLLSDGAPANGVYTGSLGEGVGFLPYLGKKISFIIKPLFGFTSPKAIAVPITSLGSAGAAVALVPNLVKQGLAGPNDIAVFTSISMCWSGYLSTHIAMMSSIGENDLSGKAIFSHTIGGLVGGIASNIIYKLIMLL